MLLMFPPPFPAIPLLIHFGIHSPGSRGGGQGKRGGRPREASPFQSAAVVQWLLPLPFSHPPTTRARRHKVLQQGEGQIGRHKGKQEGNPRRFALAKFGCPRLVGPCWHTTAGWTIALAWGGTRNGPPFGSGVMRWRPRHGTTGVGEGRPISRCRQQSHQSASNHLQQCRRCSLLSGILHAPSFLQSANVVTNGAENPPLHVPRARNVRADCFSPFSALLFLSSESKPYQAALSYFKLSKTLTTFLSFCVDTTMGNAAASERRFVKRDESFGSKSPLRTARIRQENGGGQQQQHSHRQQQQQNGSGGGTPPVKSPLLPPQNGTFGGGEPLPPPPPAPPAERNGHLRQHRFSQLSQRSHSLEQSVNGTHSPSSSRSSSSNTSYLSSMLLNGGGGAGDRNAAAAASSCLRQSVEPLFAISGDLTPHQIGLVKRTWKQALKAAGNDETELACRLLLRVFQMDPRTLVYFSLKDVPLNEFAIRSSPIFMSHVKAFEPTLVHVMNHLTNATTLSKHLQQLGGRHVNYTGVTYKCSYWKCFTQSLIDVLFPDNKGGSSSDELHDALAVLGDFCVEQMRIGYRIEYKLQCEAERYQAQVQQRRRRRDLSMQRDMQAHHHVHAHHPPRRN